jgi:hypothetical protein
MTEPRWIRMVKLKTGRIPAYAHPDDESGSPLRLSGKFSVKWPDGTITIAEVKTTKVHVLNSEEVGLYTYFEATLYGMYVIYDLHEVELMASEVVRCLAAPKMRAAS